MTDGWLDWLGSSWKPGQQCKRSTMLGQVSSKASNKKSQKSNVDTKNGYISKEATFSKAYHFCVSYLFSFRECNICNNLWVHSFLSHLLKPRSWASLEVQQFRPLKIYPHKEKIRLPSHHFSGAKVLNFGGFFKGKFLQKLSHPKNPWTHPMEGFEPLSGGV